MSKSFIGSATVITAPSPYFPSLHVGVHSIFLAGAIDMGQADDWQAWVIHEMQDVRCTLLNPRRAGGFNPNTLDEQILWELDALDKADTILMWFPAGSKAPVAMFETGIWLQSGKLVVGADPEFYRRRNLELTLRYFGVPLYADLSNLVAAVKSSVAWSSIDVGEVDNPNLPEGYFIQQGQAAHSSLNPDSAESPDGGLPLSGNDGPHP